MIKTRTTPTPARILDAALAEFAAHGYEGASTRAIAGRAGVHQPQINYHFESKRELWRAAVDHLFEQLAAELGPMVAASDDPRFQLRRLIGAFVRFAATHPELNRIMVQEAMADSERLDWIVETHVRPGYDVVTALWRRVRDQGGVPDLDEQLLYYVLVGASSLIYVNAAEARRLGGTDPTDPERVEAHAGALVDLLVPDPPRST